MAVLVSLAGVATADGALADAGDVGKTSYTTLPFASSLYQQSWGASPGLAPGNLFWQQGTNFTNSATMAAARQYADKLTAQGIVPASGSQRWEDTYEISQPASQFPGEPSWIANDRNSQNLINKAEYQAWVTWQKNHAGLFIMGSDGQSESFDFRPWRGNWGHISPLMPLPSGDWPPGISNANYGDWYAYRWGQTAGKSGAYGIMLSDFSDSQPLWPSWMMGFNPEITTKFGQYLNRTIPGSTVAQRASYINANLTPEWNDFLSRGYAEFYRSLATQLWSNTGHPALIIDQCGLWPSARRVFGTDATIIRNVMSPTNFMCIWENQTMQLGRSGKSMIWGIGGGVLAAAREPDVRNGANLSADDSAFWQAVDHFWSNLSSADRQERGRKKLKRAWLETSWSHVATRGGTTRRALAFMSRDYWDKGGLDATVQRLIQTVVPTRPFGYAVFYSLDAERRMEAAAPNAGGINATYMHPDKLMNFKNGGGVVGYYVSSVALPNLQSNAKPAAWLVLDGTLSSSELQKLQSIAPVITSLSGAQSFGNAPLGFSSGLTGMGFWDQNNRLIVTVSNPGSGGLTGTIRLRTLRAGTYVATDLFSGSTARFTVSGGYGGLAISVGRWDTRVFAITPG